MNSMMGGMAGPAAPIDPLLAEDFELESQIQQVLEQFDNSADDETQAAMRKMVADLLERQFTVRQERREREIGEIEARVKRLREALEKRTEAKKQIIDRRLNDLFSDAEGLGWGDIGGGASAGGSGTSGSSGIIFPNTKSTRGGR
ncbi:MAG: hypothetical protein EXS05_00550 [Planctomycetaceae bacterium]|nr:hypothetical protein [Planctomycetaceae bacterium]